MQILILLKISCSISGISAHGMGREPNNGEVVIDNANFGSNAIKVVSDGIDES
ncbi:hypothetical protein PGT21_009948 [Puccinia graminis f. sp. tritici]|uniref:Pectate lyase n=1 Tax=Puccinia graminis f. sp. tritici TaxID=56615 RepID=A0A5B0QAE0_PUCGR|nr:hypothetical protein PGTUg99_025408 [Puccinia graminis f. sp. tritici]KAA1090638.1 hypothetical protein PGT21_008278 [Puccinia graminis f. sp. tritici]KAA1110085.1 hypothetical protein PGT21_009948 [Puccinia graminis f. sp. tritici]